MKRLGRYKSAGGKDRSDMCQFGRFIVAVLLPQFCRLLRMGLLGNLKPFFYNYFRVETSAEISSGRLIQSYFTSVSEIKKSLGGVDSTSLPK